MKLLQLIIVLSINVALSWNVCSIPSRSSRTRRWPREILSAAKQSTGTSTGTDRTTGDKQIKPKTSVTSRSVVIHALTESTRKPSSIALRNLETDPAFLSLESRDRAFARLLLATVERRWGEIDKIMQQVVKENKKRKRPSDWVCDAAIQIGAAQIFYLETPPYAVIQETVAAVKMHPKITVAKAQVGFVNAVLRNMERKKSSLKESTSVLDNIEPTLLQAWIRSYGEEGARLIVEAAMSESPIYVTANHMSDRGPGMQQSIEESLLSDFRGSSADEGEILSNGSILVPKQQSSVVSAWPGYEDGSWWVQDPSATLPALALESTLQKEGVVFEEMHVVDLCSAPGGKTAQLCSMGFGKVTAVEVSKRRTKTLKENLRRLKMTEKCDIAICDGREWTPKDGDTVSAVLLDAPCSATGVGKRRPDVLRKSPSDLDELISLQRELAVHTVDKLLNVGSIMIYATCSLLEAESEDQMKWLLAREDGSILETVRFEPDEIPLFAGSIDENGWLRVVPGRSSSSHFDGFFVARMRRVG